MKGYCLLLISILSFENFGNSSLQEAIPKQIGQLRNLYEQAEVLSSNLNIPNANVAKQLFRGYPLDMTMTAMDKLCSAVTDTAKSSKMKLFDPDINKLNFQLRTACNKYNFPLLKARKMWMSPDFDRSKGVVIVATGFTTNINDIGGDMDQLAKAYHCRGDVNFVALDTSIFLDTLYSWSAINTDKIGLNLAYGLKELIKIIPIEKFHLIGHSLGAHIVGAAGRYFTEMTGLLLPHITGLDPAKPCFVDNDLLRGLRSTDAEFVDVIHSNPGIFGNREPLGHVDYYPNGIDPLMKGCFTAVCSHLRAVKFYAESIYPGNEHNFLAQSCTSLGVLGTHECNNGKFNIPMGYLVSHSLQGIFYSEIRAQSPFGNNADINVDRLHSTCGKCQGARNL